ncbi:Extracellular serine protease precursor [Methyloligella halotolerans]|uniref:Extracellular serine protease n=1 Tax=Methyloligella halotolerans TaxID=1177755 RepID=A0A1E2RYT0_9HYPH|nr:autotransporter-associated beta strand repeat-containing protein [Methyloligella halotolerans]ODA67265.1 Extracellular serine protease precursor [Methyloligella halotolerans]
MVTGGNALPGTAIVVNATLTVNQTETIGTLSGSGTINVASGQTLTADMSSSGTFSGTIQGDGNFTKTGTGTLNLTGSSLLTGLTTIAGGILEGDTTTLVDDIVNDAELVFDQTADGTYSSVISGTGTVTKTGAGTLILTGENTYTGGTTISAGTLQIDSDSIVGDVVNNAALTFDQATNGTFAGDISGTGSLTKINTGTLILTGSNSYTGGTTISAGTLQGDTGSLVGDIVDNAALVFDQAANGTFSGDISGSGSLTKSGVGTLILSGTNTYTGGTTISAGTLQGDTDSLTGDITDNAVLVFDQVANGTFAGDISGTGSLTKSGAGTLILSGSNSYTGGTTISAGTLQGDTTSLVGDIIDNAALVFDQGSNGTFAGDVSGAGSLTKTNSGTLILTGTNSYTGGTTISAGTLQGDTTSLTGDIVDNAALVFDQAANGTFSGDISGTGSVTKTGAGTLILSGTNSYSGGTTISAGTLQGDTTSLVGDIVDNAALVFDQGSNGTFSGDISGSGSLTKTNSGTLILSGTNSYTGGTTISAGTLQGDTTSLIGDIVDNAALVFDQTANGTFSSDISGTGSLTKTGAGTLILSGANSYTGGTTISAGTLQGDTASLVGDIVDNAALVFDQGANGTFSGDISGTGSLTKTNSGTLILSGTNSYSGGTTISAGTLQGDTTSIVGDIVDNAALVFDQGSNGTFSGDISGTGSLTKTNSGTLILSGTNSYSGGTTISAGTLQGDTTSLTGDIVDNAALIFDQAANGTFSDDIAGTGSLAKTGAGTLILSGTNTYSGGTEIDQGRLSISADANLGDGAGGLTFGGSGGTLEITSTLTSSRDVALDADGAIQVTSGNDATLAGDVSGTAGLTKTGAGRLILTGTNSYTGGTLISAGTLQGDTTSLTGDITDDAALVFDQAVNGTFSGDISGTGSLTKTNAGTLTLSGSNSYSGGTTISAGTLQGDTGSLTGDIVDNAALVFDQTANGTFSGDISGTGSLTKSGAGTLSLSGSSSYTGGTTISAGTLRGDTDSLTGDIVDNAALVFDQAFDGTYSGDISGTGSLLKTGSGLVRLSGTNSFSGGATLDAGTLEIMGTGSVASDITVNAGELIVRGTAGGNVTLNGGSLAGTGTVGALTVRSGASVAPGVGSIGTIGISGNVTFDAGSIYALDINAAGVSDLINTAGSAVLNGGLVDVLAQVGTYLPNTRYLILRALGGRVGTFSSARTNFAFLTPTLEYDADSVYLVLNRTTHGGGGGGGGGGFVSFCSVATSSNQCAVAHALDRFPTSNPLFLDILNQTAPGARQAFDALSGELHASVNGALINQSRHLRDVVIGRLVQASYGGSGLGAGGPQSVQMASADIHRGMMALGYGSKDLGSDMKPLPSKHAPTFWTQGFGSWGNFDGNGNAASLDATYGGFLSGVDAEVLPGWRAGLAAGYSTSGLDEDARLSSGKVDAYHLALYGSGRVNRFNLRGGGVWSWQDLETSRYVVFPGFYEFEKASYGGDQGQVFGELAYPLMVQRDIGAEAFSGLAYVHQRTDGFTESGAVAGLSSSGKTEEVGYSSLGLRAATSMQVRGVNVSPRASVAWLHAFEPIDTVQALAFASTDIGFDVTGTPIARDSALIEAGLDFAVSPAATLSIAYDGQIASGAEEHGIKGRASWKF